MIIVGGKARRRAHRAINIEHQTAAATHEVMVVVANSVLVTSERTSRLNAANQSLLDENPQGVVHGLARNRSDVSSHRFDELIGSCVGMSRNRVAYRQTLCGDLKSAGAQLLLECPLLW